MTAATTEATVAAWLELQGQLADLDSATPCRAPSTRDRWISDAADDQQAAAHACAPCPVLEACRTYAVAAAEPAGVWAGTRPADRRPSQPRRNA